MYEIRRTAEFSAWLAALSDRSARAAILTRLTRLSFGNPGDTKLVGSGVSEMRIDVGPGYRAYYMRSGTQIFFMLAGGNKSTQAKDIKRAITMAGALKRSERETQIRKPK